MPSPKASELLRRILLETSCAYVRFQPSPEGWVGVLDGSSKAGILKSTNIDIEKVSTQLGQHIVDNRIEIIGKSSKKYKFNEESTTSLQ